MVDLDWSDDEADNDGGVEARSNATDPTTSGRKIPLTKKRGREVSWSR